MKKNILKGIIGFALTVYAAGISCISVQAQESVASTEVIPTTYDSRQYGYVTEKKEQYGGTCWAFAAIAAAESSLIKSGLADSSIDLSEFHLVYYAHMGGFNDPLGNCSTYSGRVSSIYDAINYGGLSNDVETQFSIWSGPVLESDMPYSNREYINKIYPEVSEDLSNKCLYHLNKSVHSYSIDDTKRLIMQYGAVTGCLYIGGTNYINYKDYEYITYNFPNAVDGAVNHELSIIGWDDNYPKENFNYQPEHDGAWLVKDSDGKNQPYWYVSYETMRNYDCVAYEFEPAELLENNYMYGGRTKPVSGVNVLNTENSDMNIFEAKRSSETLEKLESIMITTLRDENRKVTIYINPVIKNNQIVDYEYKSNTFEFYFDHAGVFKVDLPEDIYLNNGDTFGIDVTDMSGESKTEDVHFDTAQGFTNSTDIPLAGEVTIDTTSKELAIGESFKIHGSVSVPAEAMAGISYTSSDTDVATVDKKGNVTAVAPGTATITAAATYGSDRKTCTVTVKPNLATSLTVEESVTMKLYDFYTLHPVVDPNATDQGVRYDSSNHGIVTVDDSGRLYAKNPGTAVITVKTTDGSNLSVSCTVKVIPPWDDTTDISGGGTDHASDTGTTTGTPTQKVVLNISRNRISIGGTATLTAATAPVVNLSKVSYLVSDSSAISLNGTTVTGLRPGTATITAVASDSGAFATVTVTVIDVKTASTDGASGNTVHKGDSFVSKKIEYTVTGSATVSVTGAGSRKIKSLTIPATVKYKGKTYKVTSIGSKAFYKCSKLKSITIKSKSLKSVGKNAFKGISKNVKVTVPKSKYNAYRKLFKKAGFGSKVTWKKG